MAHVIIGPDEAHTLAPNDCGCSEHHHVARPGPDGVVCNDCGSASDQLWNGGFALPQRAAVAATPLHPHPRLHTLPLSDGYAAAFVPSLSRIAVLDRAAIALLRRLPLTPHTCDPAERQALTALTRAGLLSADAAPTLPRPPPATTLVAWLHVTNACNLRCSYCYIDKRRATMTLATARATVDMLIASARRHGFPTLLIKYAGGEPTLQLSLIAATQRYAQQQAAAHGISLRGGVLSNGTLITSETARILHDLDLSLMVSLDGLAAINDAQRVTSGGRPSFERVRTGIDQARAAGLQPTVSITVTGQSIGGLPELVAWLLDAGLPFGVNFYREHPDSASRRELQLDEQQLIAGMRAAYAVIARRPPPWSLLASLLDRADLSCSHSHACAAGQNYLVIDHAGRVTSCQMRLDQPVTTIGVQDPLSRVRAADGVLRNPSVDDRYGCRGCDWRYWCGGGCPAVTYQSTGRYEVTSPHCRIYRELIPEVVRLEGLRLLHWFGPRVIPPAPAAAYRRRGPGRHGRRR